MVKLSIITAVRDGERFIKGCIENVISQRCPEVEHIILDSCSTDGTVEVIRKYAEEFPHIRWISEKDDGQSDAMNKGIKLAKGKFVGFLNVDDYYEQNVLKKVVSIVESCPVNSFLVGNCNVWDDYGNLLSVNKPVKLKLRQLLLGYFVNPWPVNPSAYFYDKALHEIVGMYTVSEHYALDVDFILRAIQVANVRYFDEVWGNYSFFEETKTANDLKNGTSQKRVKALLKAYRKDLPWFFRKTFGLYSVFARDIPLFINWVKVVFKKYLLF